jgi:conjugal transfer pilus assembly protein TraU
MKTLLRFLGPVGLATALATFGGNCTAQVTQGTSITCHGKFPNPITDVCWSCMFPMKIGGVTIAVQGQEDNASSSGTTVCTCQNGANVTVGVMTEFWEPSRIFEAPRSPWCFPTLGGITMNFGVNAPEHGRDPPMSGGRSQKVKKSFYQAHWYNAPYLFVLQVMMDNPCLEQAYFDLAYMTEVDPLWNDDEATFVLNPDAVLFANPIAQAVCLVDCALTSAGFSNNLLFWCAGCEGSMYPLTGNVQHHNSGIQASQQLLVRMTNKLHREGLMWTASGPAGQCGYSIQPIMDKTNYKSSMLFPLTQAQGSAFTFAASSTGSCAQGTSIGGGQCSAPNQNSGRCCQPYGRSDLFWSMGHEFPYYGEDFSYLIFRKRQCCTGTSLGR